MTEEIKKYESDDLSVRFIIVDNSPWFLAKDVVEMLGYRDVGHFVRNHTLEEDRAFHVFGQKGVQKRRMFFINQRGLVDILFSTDKPEAEPVKEWLIHKAVPFAKKTKPSSVRQFTSEKEEKRLMCTSSIAEMFSNCNAKKIHAILMEENMIRPVPLRGTSKVDYYELYLNCRNLGEIIQFSAHKASRHQLKFNEKGVKHICKLLVKRGFRIKDRYSHWVQESNNNRFIFPEGSCKAMQAAV